MFFPVPEEIVYSISFLIFWKIINLTYVSQLGDEDSVTDYIFTSQRESHSVPDMDFLLYLQLFCPIWSYREQIYQNNFKCFNGNCDYSSCPG